MRQFREVRLNLASQTTVALFWSVRTLATTILCGANGLENNLNRRQQRKQRRETEKKDADEGIGLTTKALLRLFSPVHFS